MTRKRRYLICAAVFASCVGIALGVLAIMPWQPERRRDAWEKYRQVHEGMSENEVTALFGVPPGQYISGIVEICTTGQTEEYAAVDGCHSKSVWQFDEGLFEIGFDENSRVQKKVASACGWYEVPSHPVFLWALIAAATITAAAIIWRASKKPAQRHTGILARRAATG